MASEKAHPPSAFLWCQWGELNKQAGNTAEAISDYEQCINWIENDRELENLRLSAAQLLNSLRK